MNSKVAIIALLCSAASGISMNSSHQVRTSVGERGIFGRMIEQVEAPEENLKEKEFLKTRKKKQLEDAEKDYQRMVQIEEQEDAAKKKKDDEEAENAALEAAKKTPQAQMLAAANSAASNINMGDLESTIQAQLQAKLDSGLSKAELMGQINSGDDSLTQTTSLSAAAATTTTQSASVSSIMAKVLAKHKAAAPVATSTPVAMPAPVAPVAVAQKPAALVQAKSAAEVEAKASQEKVREMAQKLGIPFTADLMALGSNSDISDSLIEKAVAAGKSEAQINAAITLSKENMTNLKHIDFKYLRLSMERKLMID